MGKERDTATFGGGCFWCLDALFQQLKGVDKVISGFAGGQVANPSYEHVCDGTTGHAEVVQIIFDPSVISYRELVEIFFVVHDPTTRDRQGNDVGPQYRSIILYKDAEQKQVAEETLKNFVPKYWDKPVVTELTSLDDFYAAEDYHQDYFNKNPEKAYCQVVINPKLQKFKKEFESKLK